MAPLLLMLCIVWSTLQQLPHLQLAAQRPARMPAAIKCTACLRQVRTRLLLPAITLEALGTARLALALGVPSHHSMLRYGGAVVGAAVYVRHGF